jgi:hypothetical protein
MFSYWEKEIREAAQLLDDVHALLSLSSAQPLAPEIDLLALRLWCCVEMVVALKDQHGTLSTI